MMISPRRFSNRHPLTAIACLLVACATSGTAASLRAGELPEGFTFSTALESVGERLQLTSSSSMRLVSTARIPEIRVENPAIIAVTPLSPTEIQLTARQAGTTKLVIRNEQGATQTIVVNVCKQDDGVQRLQMTTNTSRRFVNKTRLTDIMISNPDMLSVTPLSPTEIQISAKKAGVAQLTMLDEHNVTKSMDVLILGDVQELAMVLKLHFPKAELEVTRLTENALVRGLVEDPDQEPLIMRVVQEYFPAAINGLTLGERKQIVMDVKLIEVSRTKLAELGLQDTGLLQLAGVSKIIDCQSGDESFKLGILDANQTCEPLTKLLTKTGLAKVLAAPQLTTSNRQPTCFISGKEVPNLLTQSISTPAVQYHLVGTRLDLVPILRDEGKTLRLEARPRIGWDDKARGVIVNNVQLPAFQQREVDTGLEMKPGETMAFAGLPQHRDGEDVELLILVTARVKPSSLPEGKAELMAQKPSPAAPQSVQPVSFETPATTPTPMPGLIGPIDYEDLE